MMSVNPYQPPTGMASDSVEGDVSGLVARGDHGPWCDGKQLVINLNEPNLPARCLVTGDADDLCDVPIKASAIRPGVVPKILIGLAFVLFLSRRWLLETLGMSGEVRPLISFLLAFLAVALWLSQNRTLEIAVPVSGGVMQATKRRRRRGILLGILFVAGIAALVLLVGWITPTTLVQGLSPLWIAVSIAAVIGLLSLALISALRQRDFIAVVKVTGDYAWIRNVDPDYLSRIAAWHGSPKDS